MSGRTYDGTSGKHYSYGLFSTDDLDNLPLQGGNYIFANKTSTPVFIEAAENVRKSVMDSNFWPIAREVHGASLVLVNFEGNSPEERHQQKMDLIHQYHPTMNKIALAPG